jgi:hypothetical protein
MEGDGTKRANMDTEGATIAFFLVDVYHARLLVLGQAFLRACRNARRISTELASHRIVDDGLDADAVNAGIDRRELAFMGKRARSFTILASGALHGINHYEILVGRWH